MSQSAAWTQFIMSGLEEALKPEGFKRKATTFVRDTGEVAQILGLQRSSNSSASCLRITLNIGLHAKVLMDPDERVPRSTSDCQSQFRLSQIMPGPFEDRWWSITDGHEAETALQEMRVRLTSVAVPTLDTVKRSVDILREWSDGGNRNLAPGIEFNRLRFVKTLEDKLGQS